MEDGGLYRRLRQILNIEEELDDDMREEAANLIRNVFRYLDEDAKDIMTHRKNIVAIDAEETLEDALKIMLRERYSRFPIYEEDIDSIIGIFHLKETVTCYLNENLRKVPVKDLKTWLSPVTFIPETKSIDTLFREMQAEKYHIAVVLDEYGQTSGLVTMEDILEEIVGNILDEHDVEEEMIKQNPDGSLRVNGMVDLEELEEWIPVKFEKEEYETLNGFIIDNLEHIPSPTEKPVVEFEGYRFTVLSVHNNTIGRVRIEKII
ncbi:MAG: hemolysin family protein [Lachnospiraceae bacterium]|jgi:putative hemolysin|nr:hemolysin family protein [Lachnospiraceae bacterium]